MLEINKYDWADHVKRVVRLLHSDGSGWTNKAVHAEDVNGRSCQPHSTGAVKFSFAGANARALIDSLPMRADGKGRDFQVYSRRLVIMGKMYAKVGIPVTSKSVASAALYKFSADATWDGVQKVLRAAYTIARKAQG